MEAKLALARCVVEPCARRGGGAGGGGAFHARRAGGAAAGGGRRGWASARRPRPPAAAARRRARIGSASEARRLISQGGVRVDGEPVRARRARARRSRDGCSRRGSGGSSCASSGLTAARTLLSCLGCPRRAAMEGPCNVDDWSALEDATDTTAVPCIRRPPRESEAFFRRSAARSLKTQQRAKRRDLERSGVSPWSRGLKSRLPFGVDL